MNINQNMNNALSYIEQNLEYEVDMAEVAKRAFCSEYHFSRMFSFLAGMTLSEYIRCRRLTLSAFELEDENKKIIDIAIKYGYSSPDSFTRAFIKFHGITPSKARERRSSLKAFPPMAFQLIIKGGTILNYRIEEKKEFYVIGLKKTVPMQFEGENPAIKDMVTELGIDNITYLKSCSDMLPDGLISASTNFSEGREQEKGELDHYIGVASNKKIEGKFDILPIPASSWVVFEVIGEYPAELQSVWGRIFSEWIPSSSYELFENGVEILWNEGSDINKKDYKSEIWIQVVKID